MTIYYYGIWTQDKLYPKDTEQEVLIWINFTLQATSQMYLFDFVYVLKKSPGGFVMWLTYVTCCRRECCPWHVSRKKRH